MVFSLEAALECRVQLITSVQAFETALIPWLERDLFEAENVGQDASVRSSVFSANRKMVRRRAGSQMAFAMVALLDVSSPTEYRGWILISSYVDLDGQRRFAAATASRAASSAG
jgi:hypothetical protein